MASRAKYKIIPLHDFGGNQQLLLYVYLGIKDISRRLSGYSIYHSTYVNQIYKVLIKTEIT